MKRHVALVGFMAAGKSTIGRRLARKLRRPFVDTDELVARSHGPVAQIFAQEGEAAFRRYEREAIEQVLDRGEGSVVALGGGAVTIPENRQALRDGAHSIFLKVSPEQVLARVTHGRQKRPLLGRKPTLAAIRELYNARLPYYACADHVVEAHCMSDREVIDDILQWLRDAKIDPRA